MMLTMAVTPDELLSLSVGLAQRSFHYPQVMLQAGDIAHPVATGVRRIVLCHHNTVTLSKSLGNRPEKRVLYVQ